MNDLLGNNWGGVFNVLREFFGGGGTASISFGFVIRGHDFWGGGLDNSKLNSSIIKHVFSFCTQNQLLKIEYSIVNSQ